MTEKEVLDVVRQALITSITGGNPGLVYVTPVKEVAGQHTEPFLYFRGYYEKDDGELGHITIRSEVRSATG